MHTNNKRDKLAENDQKTKREATEMNINIWVTKRRRFRNQTDQHSTNCHMTERQKTSRLSTLILNKDSAEHNQKGPQSPESANRRAPGVQCVDERLKKTEASAAAVINLVVMSHRRARVV